MSEELGGRQVRPLVLLNLGESQPEPQTGFGHPYSVTQLKVKQINSKKQEKEV